MKIKFSLSLVLKIFIVIAALTLPWWARLFTMQLTIRGLYLSILAMSFVFLAGYGDMTSLAQMSFASMAGYVIAIGAMKYGVSHDLLIPLGLLGGTLLSAVFGLIAIRAHKIYFMIMTLALSLLFYGVGMQWASMTGGSDGYTGLMRPEFFGFSFSDPRVMYFLTLFLTGFSYYAMKRIVNSPFGIALQGIRDNPKRMAALGFNVQLHRYIAIIISGFFASVAGIIILYFTGVILPERAHLPSSVQVIMAALVGGVTTLQGGLLGGVLMAFIISITSQYTLRYWTVIGTLFVIIVMFLPNGLLGSKDKITSGVNQLLAFLRNALFGISKEKTNQPDASQGGSYDEPAN
jgi:branched-chain amino acid transport system permease protein